MRIYDADFNFLPRSTIPLLSRQRFSQWNTRHPGLHNERRRDRRRTTTHIAVLDTETDPFDNNALSSVYPFLAILYSDQFEPMVFWQDNWKLLIAEVKNAIEALSDRYIIYAHNGGRFDFMFFIHELRGKVMFKGRSLMSAKIGRHELRDSFHILPEKLQAIGGKDTIDYNDMRKSRRNRPATRKRIIDYCLADCRYLFDSVSAFRKKYGSPLTIGQAAIRELRKSYDVANLDEQSDAYMRQYFFGGRVECFRFGVVRGDYNLFDVNSMYPFVMARFEHPTGNDFFLNDHIREGRTAFISVRCRNNGALVSRAEDGSLTTRQEYGVFNTTISEYTTAYRLGLITDCEIIRTIEFKQFSNFENFVEPIYHDRQLKRKSLKEAETNGDIMSAKQLRFDILFAKLLLNNAYGKFAQNPRRFKDTIITGFDEVPEDYGFEDELNPWGSLPEIETDEYRIWSKPNAEFRFNNVATAASITGAARAVLLDALHGAHGVLYCDTDSLICNGLSSSVKCDPFELGSWDIEARINTFIGNGKKLYAYQHADKEPPQHQVIKAKGMNGVTWDDMLAISQGQTLTKYMLAPTLRKDGSQQYISRELRRTGV